ncbi:MAG: DUF4304 domain-containing protein [Sedimentisphaerales bacterium]|nr:DUF4304 domain-containing protein [Sedimentisphaerales bacterium]
MVKSNHRKSVDLIQEALRPFLKRHGFKARGRTFNRITNDGLTQVINIQMGPSDPSGTIYIPGLRENMHGLFTINLGIYVPEVALYHMRRKAKSWIQEYDCCVRARLGELCGEGKEIWWKAIANESVIRDVSDCLEVYGMPFLERFSTRDQILTEWNGRSEDIGAITPIRIVLAIILYERGQKKQARELLSQQVLETRNPGHPDYIRKLASDLNLGSLD